MLSAVSVHIWNVSGVRALEFEGRYVMILLSNCDSEDCIF